MIRLILSIFCTVFLFVSVGLAQDQPRSATVQPAPSPKTPDPDDSSKAQMDDLRKSVEAAESENAKLKDKLDKLSGRMDEVEEAAEDALQGGEIEEFKQRLDIYGFLDVDFFYYDFQKEDSTYLVMPNKPSFTENHLNLYFSAQMERTLSVLAEVRFSYLPNGNDASIGIPALGSKYTRANTRTTDYYDWQDLILHSVMIERAVFTWRPADFFSIAAGRFITPFGIWVTDHSPTVSIPARLPHLIAIDSIPLAQTGIEVFGRVFPLSDTSIDYALTLSNGRGPSEALFDLDNHKALGLRLKGTYEITNFSASVGGYMYWGTYTDSAKEILVGKDATLNYNINITERYEEISTALDLTLDIYRLRLQGEYCRQPRIYSVRPKQKMAIFGVDDPLGGYPADSVSWFSYGLLAYRIPLQIADGETDLTPFVLYEYNIIDYYYPKAKAQGLRVGLNFKPSPFVAIKYEIASERVDAAAIPGMYPGIVTKYWVHSAQVAVSF